MQIAMERTFAAAGLDWRYLTLDVLPENLGPALRGLQSLGFHGAHLTRPHPAAAIPHLDRLVGSASIAGWVDCVTIEPEAIVGHNRWGGALQVYLKSIFLEPAPRVAFLLGTERGLLAMATELATQAWDTIWVSGIDPQLVAEINQRLEREAIRIQPPRKRWPNEIHLFVRGTEAQGQTPSLKPDALDHLTPDGCVIDLARPTSFSPLTRDAEERGLHHLSGLEAMVRYAADTFQLWTRTEPSPQILRDALEEYYEI